MTCLDSLQLSAVRGLKPIERGDDLAALIAAAFAASDLALRAGDVVVVAQKIVSKSEGRLLDLATVVPSPRAIALAGEVGKDPRLVEAILSESLRVVRKRPGLLIVEHRLGFVMANAGVDQSNVAAPDGRQRVLLLPENPDASAAALRERLRTLTGASVGVIINDSFGRAWRRGTVGVALGTAGLPALIDLRGRPISSAARSKSASSASPTRSPPPPRSSWARRTRGALSCSCAASPGPVRPPRPRALCARRRKTSSDDAGPRPRTLRRHRRGQARARAGRHAPGARPPRHRQYRR